MWINGVSDKFPQTDNSGPVRVKIPISDKALKQQHKTNETVMNKMKMGWNCNSDDWKSQIQYSQLSHSDRFS